MRYGTKRGTTGPAVTRERDSVSVGQTDRESVPFAAADETRSPLDTLVREGARKILQVALEDEVQLFLDAHAARVDEHGRRLVVRNGHLPARQIVTGAGPLDVRQGQHDVRADWNLVQP